MAKIELQKVTLRDEVFAALMTFNREARSHSSQARKEMLSTHYWIYHEVTEQFVPNKFAGFAGMNFEFHRNCSVADRVHRLPGFTGPHARAAIERTLGVEYHPNPELHQSLREWATVLLGVDPFGETKQERKWQFITLGTQGGETVENELQAFIPRSPDRGQGYVSDAEERKALEDAAMDAAEIHFKSLGYSVQVRGKPYDLYCTRGSEVLYVEVKGTKSIGEKVFLTSGEVEFARSNRGSMVLFLLHSIELVRIDDEIRAEGGKACLFFPWNLDDGVLKPTEYEYQLPVRPC